MSRSLINSFGDFERNFGKLHPDYPLSYAVRDFYQNGGAQAVVVRLYKPTDTKPAKAIIRIAISGSGGCVPRHLGQQLESAHRRRRIGGCRCTVGLDRR